MNSGVLAVAHFFLSLWLWSITWGLYHLPLAIFFMMILIKRYTKLRITPIILISFFSPLLSLCVLNLVTILCVVYGLGLEYTCPNATESLHTNVPAVCVSLGIAYTALHGVFCVILNRFYPLKVGRLARLGAIAHAGAAWMMYLFASLYYL